jgi:S-adenosylmethionine uptake transporter
MQSFWMLAAALAFGAMGGLVKLVSAQHGAFEVVFWRGLASLALIGGWVASQRGSLATAHVGMHLKRSVVGTSSMLCWFYGLGQLPLATAVTLNYTSPIFLSLLVAIAAWRGHKPAAPRAWLYVAVAVGFSGVLLILRPTVERGHELALTLGLSSGLLSAHAYRHVQALGRIGEPAWRIVFWFSLVNVAMGGAGALLGGFTRPTIDQLALLLSIGVLAMCGQLMMTRAFSQGRTLLTANLQYATVVVATVIGWLAFDETMAAPELAGIGLVAVSSLLATWASGRAAATGPAQALHAVGDTVAPADTPAPIRTPRCAPPR